MAAGALAVLITFLIILLMTELVEYRESVDFVYFLSPLTSDAT